MKRTFLLLMMCLMLFPSIGHTAYVSDICEGDPCKASEVGPFMQDISKACGNSGDCTLDDIMQVFVNVGNWVVGIIGAVVLLMYVAGGFYWLASAGRKEWVEKGKKLMMISTIGLLIVMFSHLAIQALKSSLRTGDITNATYVTCSGEGTKGMSCDLNATCDKETGFTCEYK